MPDGPEPATIRVIDRIAEVAAAEWDACAGSDRADGNPFLSHAFLHALEESGSVCAKTGWRPQHLLVTDKGGRLVGAAPMYLKGHSYGEYVFDHSWAAAYERAGGQYYPKLQVAVPFTPVTGPRLLVRRDGDAAAVRKALAAGMVEALRRYDLSSLHVTFPTEPEAMLLEEQGFLLRHGHQFHWHNKGYGSFEDFLGDLASRKRKNIAKERRRVAEAGIEIRILDGGEILPRHWNAFHRFYIDTYDRKWGYPYLTRDFFDRLSATMADKVVLVMAERDDRPIAGALNFRGGDALYGRNWGCAGDYRFLHFECCYYSAIDYAIAHGLKRVEAGTQGPHKIQRGYLPERTYSAHWIPDRRFRDAVARFLEHERVMEAAEIDGLAEFAPFRQGD